MQRRAQEAARAGRVPWSEGFRRLSFGGVSAPRRSDALKAESKAQAEAETEAAEGSDG